MRLYLYVRTRTHARPRLSPCRDGRAGEDGARGREGERKKVAISGPHFVSRHTSFFLLLPGAPRLAPNDTSPPARACVCTTPRDQCRPPERARRATPADRPALPRAAKPPLGTAPAVEAEAAPRARPPAATTRNASSAHSRAASGPLPSCGACGMVAGGGVGGGAGRGESGRTTSQEMRSQGRRRSLFCPVRPRPW